MDKRISPGKGSLDVEETSSIFRLPSPEVALTIPQAFGTRNPTLLVPAFIELFPVADRTVPTCLEHRHDTENGTLVAARSLRPELRLYAADNHIHNSIHLIRTMKIRVQLSSQERRELTSVEPHGQHL